VKLLRVKVNRLIRLLDDTQSVVMTPSFSSIDRHQGPWPQCLQNKMTGTDCERMIKVYADDVVTQIVKPGEMITMDFRTDRVRIYVNETGYVSEIPGRG